MAKFYVAFDTVLLAERIQGNESLVDLLRLLCHAKEFEDRTLRQTDKALLNQLNNNGKKKGTSAESGLRFPIVGKIKTREQKVECILQAVLSHKTLDDFSVRMESQTILSTGVRIARFMREYLVS